MDRDPALLPAVLAWNETIARFLILAGHELQHLDRQPGTVPRTFEGHLNQEQLNKVRAKGVGVGAWRLGGMSCKTGTASLAPYLALGGPRPLEPGVAEQGEGRSAAGYAIDTCVEQTFSLRV